MKNHGNILNGLLGTWELALHLIKLEIEAKRMEINGWTDENIEGFLIKWSNKYYGGGRYEDEDVREVLKCYGVDSERIETVLKNERENG